MKGIWNTLTADYGYNYVATVVFFFALVKGFSGSLVKGLALPYFQDERNVTLAEYHAIYTFVFLMPWCVKPIFGIVSDLVPVCGYRKRNYVRVSMLTCAMTAVYVSTTDDPIIDVVIALAVFMLGVVFADLLMEASYSETLRDKARLSGNHIVLLAWSMAICGYAISAVAAGVVGDAGYSKQAFMGAAIPPFLFLCFGAHQLPEPLSRFSSAKIERFTGHVLLSLVMSLGAIMIGVFVFYKNLAHIIPVTLVITGLIIYISKKVLPDTVFWCNMFMFVAEASYFNFVGATDYFYTSGCANSPNFNFTFYTTYSMMLSAVFAGVGLLLFSCVQHLQIKTLFAVLTILRIVAASAEVLQAARWNTDAGIDDKTFFLLGEAVVQPAVSMLFAVPMILLTTRLVERGSEAILYALLAGTQNLGCLVGSVAGQITSEQYALKNCDYQKLPQALVLGHMAVPLVCVPLAFLMLPNTSLRR
jgi:MFS family permease